MDKLCEFLSSHKESLFFAFILLTIKFFSIDLF